MIELSDDRARLDLDRIHGWLATSYGTPGIALATVARAMAGSHPLGAYRDGVRVGFARVRRMLLVTRDAHSVYAGVGFTPLVRPERHRERLSPALAAVLRTAP